MNKKITLAAFRRWVAAQPKTKIWDYYNDECCPFAEFLKSLGHTYVSVGTEYWNSAQTTEFVQIPVSVQKALGRAILLGTDIPQPRLIRACL